VAPCLQLTVSEIYLQDPRYDPMDSVFTVSRSDIVRPRFTDLMDSCGITVQMRVLYEYYTSSVQVYMADSGMLWSMPCRIPNPMQ
jgi:hypothetical protein